MLESIEELSEIIEDPKLTPVPSVLDSIEEMDNIMENGFEPVDVQREEDQTEDDEIVFKKDRPARSREEILDEDTMPEFESTQVNPTPKIDQVAPNKNDIVGREDLPESQVDKIGGSKTTAPSPAPAPGVDMEDDYDQDDDYFYEEDEEDYATMKKLPNFKIKLTASSPASQLKRYPEHPLPRRR